MRIRLGLMLAAAIVLGTATLAQRPIVIDGTKLPGMTEVTGAELPEYLVWRSVFRMLRNVNLELDRERARDPDREPSFPYIAGLSAPERDLILETAIRSAEAEAASWDRQKKALADMQARGPDWVTNHRDELRRALWEIDYAQRVTTLQERDALLLQLMPEAREAFASWVESQRQGIASSVPTAELDDYRRPS